MAAKDMLVVSAHAADYCTRAGGTIAKYVKMGWNVSVIALTCGARGESGSYWVNNPNGTEEDCSAIRERESRAAAEFLGIKEITFWNKTDYPLIITEDMQRRLTRTVLDMRPDIILTHWIDDPTNTDHEKTGKAVIDSVCSGAQIGAFPNTPAHYFPNLFFFESTVPYSEFNKFEPDAYVNIDDTYETKMGAIKKFECQPQLGGYYTHFAKHRGFQATAWKKEKITYAEGFKRFFPYIGDGLPLTMR